MSSPFANPAANASAAATAYTKSMYDLVGERDPLTIQTELLPALCDLTAGLSTEELHRPEAPGKWSVLQVLDHLTDAELVMSYRLRAVVSEDRPRILAYDQDLWAQQLRYGTADPDKLLAELEALRGRTLRLLRSLTPAEMERVGMHSERGPETIRHMTVLMAGHDLAHRRQIARIRTAFGKPAESIAS